ncbi:glycosyltransferase family 4 protein [Haloferula sp.]|uniref:glycosyltransferase family 4 protein n=1 Tax=Haloferula sp. TaxID=2497595 RepID=UPI00329FED51
MKPHVIYAGMTSWYINHTARESEVLGGLAGYWMGNKCPAGVPREKYKRIWPYHLAQKAFYHLPFSDLEERMRWRNLPFYDAWMNLQEIPDGVNVVQGPMGSCEPLFKLAENKDSSILKVFDAPNSHPYSLFEIWQGECDRYSNGFRIPIHLAIKERIKREIDAADVVLCPSLFVRDSMIANGVPEEKCFVSHFGVDTSVFTEREKLPDKPRFICVGSLTVRKGHQYLFPAFEKVKQRVPEAELVCVGDVRPDFQTELKKWQGTFTHHLGVPHARLAKMLAESTAFVMASLEEGFARVLSEAMAAGLPILATFETGATTVVRDGIEGIIFKSRDVDGIADAMMRMISEPETNLAMGHAAYAAGAERNTWNDYTKRLLNEYQRRLGEL